MELDVQVDPQQLDGIAPSSISQPANGKEGGKDPERFYCPYPGCNRSFAELWRLKVHFRAPPDIRGSGKERGHGTELTHCPKCGKTLKPGKHHVGCSGSKTNARQASKRSRAAGEAELPDDTLATSPTAKQLKVIEVEGEPLTGSWQEYARSHGSQPLHHVALPGSLKQEPQEWPSTIQPGIIYGPNGAATACWLPGQVNSFVPQLQAQGYPPPQYAAEIPFTNGAHGYSQQVPAGFPGLPGTYPQPALQALPEPGQVLSLPAAGPLQQLAGVPNVQAGAVPGLNTVIFHQQQAPHDASSLMQTVHGDHQAAGQQQQQQQPQQQHLGSGPGHQLGQQVVQVHPHPHHQQQHHHQQQQQPQPGMLHPVGSGGCDGGQAQPQHVGRGGGGRGGTTASGATGGAVGGDAVAATCGTSEAAGSIPQQPAQATNSGDSLGSVFGDVEEFTRDFGRIPSPPPLPADFHSASAGSGGGVLFNFAQFGQKLPRSQSHTRLDRSLPAVGLGMDAGLEGDLLYDHTDDGDLMQLLFGVPDELPTMATIHLHKWTNENDEEDDDRRTGQAAADPASSHQMDTPPAPPQQMEGNATSNQNNALGERSSSPTACATTPPQQTQQGVEQPQPPLASGDPTGQPQMMALNNVKAETPIGGLDVHSHANGVESYLAHGVTGGGGGGGKVVLMNGMNGQNHTGDEHHRDHLLDAETFRLLQSCD